MITEGVFPGVLFKEVSTHRHVKIVLLFPRSLLFFHSFCSRRLPPSPWPPSSAQAETPPWSYCRHIVSLGFCLQFLFSPKIQFHRFISSINKYLTSPYYVSSTVLAIKNTELVLAGVSQWTE